MKTVKGLGAINRMRRIRGPRHLVYGTVGPDEFLASYADTPEEAEEAAEILQGRAGWISIIEPDGHASLIHAAEEAGIACWNATEAEREAASSRARAIGLALLRRGVSETRTAEVLSTNRETIRRWRTSTPAAVEILGGDQ